jgi:hypothetical protein
MTTPSACRALSARIQDPNDMTVTNVEIALALGWMNGREKMCRFWCSQDKRTDLTEHDFIKAWAPQYLTSVDATRAEWPEEWWIINMYQRTSTEWHLQGGRPMARLAVNAPTEPAARAALLLEIRAVELEAKENNNG